MKINEVKKDMNDDDAELAKELDKIEKASAALKDAIMKVKKRYTHTHKVEADIKKMQKVIQGVSLLIAGIKQVKKTLGK